MTAEQKATGRREHGGYEFATAGVLFDLSHDARPREVECLTVQALPLPSVEGQLPPCSRDATAVREQIGDVLAFCRRGGVPKGFAR